MHTICQRKLSGKLIVIGKMDAALKMHLYRRIRKDQYCSIIIILTFLGTLCIFKMSFARNTDPVKL